MKSKDLTGQRFGRLVVVERVQNHGKNMQARWLCKCDCGNETTALSDNLKRGNVTSCGCYRKEKTAEYKTIHGMNRTRLHRIWLGMKNRCCNPNNHSFQYWGARGITVCEEWKNNFQTFYDWAMSNGYADNLSIDRIDVNGNYCPENCRWATTHEQRINQRRNKKEA